MSRKRSRRERADGPSDTEPFMAPQYTSDVFPTERGPVPGRPWYHPRPQPRRRADLMGFNIAWWLLATFVVVLVVILALSL